MKKNKKTILILCSKSEYDFITKKLNKIIDTENEEALLPYEFFYSKLMDKKIKEKNIIESISNEGKKLLYKSWFFKKLQHFKDTIKLADEIAIIETDVPTTLDDLAEKQEELNHVLEFRKNKKIPFRIFKNQKLTYQKTR